MLQQRHVVCDSSFDDGFDVVANPGRIFPDIFRTGMGMDWESKGKRWKSPSYSWLRYNGTVFYSTFYGIVETRSRQQKVSIFFIKKVNAPS